MFFKTNKIFMKKQIYLLFLVVVFFSCQNSTPNNNQKSIERKPDYTVSEEGIKVGVYSYEAFKPFLNADNDTTYVVNFWATWCKPCVEELPHFEQLYQEYKDKKVRLILVSLDFEKQLKTSLLPFIKENKLQGEVVVLQQKGMDIWIDKINPTWSGSIPATIIYNKNKKAFFEKMFTQEELKVAVSSVVSPEK